MAAPVEMDEAVETTFSVDETNKAVKWAKPTYEAVVSSRSNNGGPWALGRDPLRDAVLALPVRRQYPNVPLYCLPTENKI
jgi:hypothetical protein